MFFEALILLFLASFVSWMWRRFMSVEEKPERRYEIWKRKVLKRKKKR